MRIITLLITTQHVVSIHVILMVITRIIDILPRSFISLLLRRIINIRLLLALNKSEPLFYGFQLACLACFQV